MRGKYKQGKFIPHKPEKYAGDINNIVFRSSWERKVMMKLDSSPNVRQWASEEKPIPYYDTVQQKERRYFIDFYVIWVNPNNGNTSKIAIEVKPYAQTVPPTPPKRNTEKAKQRHLNDQITYQNNCDKWKAASEWCKKNGFKFMILTENEINKL